MKKARRILTLAVAAALAASMLTACQSKEKQTYFEENSAGEIVDSELLEKIEQEAEPLNTKVENYNCHSGRNLFFDTGNYVTFNDKFMYVYSGVGDQGRAKIDLQSGEVIPLCNVAGCTHDRNNFPECVNNRYIYLPTAAGDEVWYIDNNKLVAINGDKEEVIYENNYCSKLDETQPPDAKYSILYFIADDNYVYIFGLAYVLQLDRNTMQVSKTIDLPTEGALRTPFVYNGSIYFTNELLEAFRTDIESGETIKLGDHINCMYVNNDTVYYTAYSDTEAFVLYTVDLDLKNPKKLIENCYSDFAVKDNKLFYHGAPSSGQGETIMCYDLDSGESKPVYDGFSEADGIIAADFSDRVFFLGEETNPDDASKPYKVIASVRTDGSDLWVKKF